MSALFTLFTLFPPPLPSPPPLGQPSDASFYRGSPIASSPLRLRCYRLLLMMASTRECGEGDGNGWIWLALVVSTIDGEPSVFALLTGESISLISRIFFPYRYPEDEYDRIWAPFLPQGSWSESLVGDVVREDNFHVPDEVMRSLVRPANGSTLNFAWPVDESRPRLPFVLYKHFAELRYLTAEESRIFNFSENGFPMITKISPPYLKTTSWFSTSPRYYRSLEFSVYKEKGSTLPPTINAMQIYQIKYLEEGATYHADVEAMLQIKSSLKVQKNWMGDPCAPKKLSWEGLICDYGISPYRVISVDLSSSSLTGSIPDSFTSLSKLKFLDLSTNNLTGDIPKSLASLTNLKFLNITCNKLNNYIPEELMADAKLTIVSGQCLPAESAPDYFDEGPVKKKVRLEVVLPYFFLSLLVVALGAMLICLWRCKSTKPRLHPSDCRNFTYNELIVMTRNFAELIGEGGNFDVFLGSLQNGKSVVVKVLRSHVQPFTDEVRILQTTHHKYLIPLIGYCQEKDKVTCLPFQTREKYLALVYEYFKKGTLAENISGRNDGQILDWQSRLQIAYEAAQGLLYLHCGCRGTIVHGDIKAKNILLADDYSARIAGFGSSKFLPAQGGGDHEDTRTGEATPKSDVYGFGVILIELVTGESGTPYDPENNAEMVSWVDQRIERTDLDTFVDHRLHGCYSSQSIVDVMKLARGCIDLISDLRPDMRDVEAQLKNCISLEDDRLRENFSGNPTRVNPVYNAPR